MKEKEIRNYENPVLETISLEVLTLAVSGESYGEDGEVNVGGKGEW